MEPSAKALCLAVLLTVLAVRCASEEGYCNVSPGEVNIKEGEKCGNDFGQEYEDIARSLKDISAQLLASKEAVAALSQRLDRQEEVVKELKRSCQTQSSAAAKGAEENKGMHIEETALQQYGPMLGKTIARFRRAFYDHFTLLAAVKAESDVTCSHTMHKSSDGLSRYVAVGDARGNLYFFSMKGDLLFEHQTGTKSPVRSMTSYNLDRNHTALLTGHEDGNLRKHVILDKVIRPYPGSRPDPLIEEISTDELFVPLNGTEPDGAHKLAVIPAAIAHIFTTRSSGRRTIFLADESGLFVALWGNGTVKASQNVGLIFRSFRVERAHIIAIHEKGMSMLSTTSGRHLQDMDCPGFNDSTIQSAVFDSHTTTRAYASTIDGELLTYVIEKNIVACRVRHRQQINLPPGPVHMGILKGYLVLSSNLGIAIYNTTMSMRTGPREVILEPHSKIGAAFGQEIASVANPHVTSGDSLLVLGLGGNGVAAIFESHLPTQKPLEFNPKLWQQPIFIGAMVLVGFWQFMKHRGAPPPPAFGGYQPQFRPRR